MSNIPVTEICRDLDEGKEIAIGRGDAGCLLAWSSAVRTTAQIVKKCAIY